MRSGASVGERPAGDVTGLTEIEKWRLTVGDSHCGSSAMTPRT
jgi:hypothetical protein